MSHEEICSTSLQGVNRELLTLAIAMTAKQLKGSVSDSFDTVLDGRNLKESNGHKIISSIRTTALRRGVGIAIDNEGKLLLAADSDDMRGQTFNQLKTLLQDVYTSLALAKILRDLGFQVQANQTNEAIFLKGVKPHE